MTDTNDISGRPRVVSARRSPGSPDLAWRLAIAGVLLLAAVLYLGVLPGEMVWDDHVLIGTRGDTGETLVGALSKPFLLHYFRPLVSVSFFVDRHAWASRPWASHLFNIVLHVGGVAALIAAAWEAFRRRSVALLSGAFLAVQPAQVGAIAWIGGRTDALSVLFLALFAWQTIKSARYRDRRARHLAIAFVWYTLALFAKEQILFTLLLVPLAYRCFSPPDERPPAVRRWLATAPFIVVLAVYLVLGRIVGMPHPEPLPHDLAGMLGRLGGALVYACLLLLAPTPQWSFTLSLGGLGVGSVWPILGGAAIACGIGVIYRRWLYTAPAACWFLALSLLAWLPVSNLFPMPFLLVAPYRAALPGLGVAVLLGWLTANCAAGLGGSLRGWLAATPPARMFGAVFLAYLLVWGAGLTAWSATQWSSEEGTFRTFVRLDPDSIVARYTLAEILLDRRRPREAVATIEQMLNRLLGPGEWVTTANVDRALSRNPGILRQVSESHGNLDKARWWLAQLFDRLGAAAWKAGDQERSADAFETANHLAPGDPEANEGIGICAYGERDYERAEEALRFALSQDKKRNAARAYLAYTYMALGRWREAREQTVLLPEHDPDALEVWMTLARDLAEAGDRAGEISTLQEARRRYPKDPVLPRLLAERRQPAPGGLLPAR